MPRHQYSFNFVEVKLSSKKKVHISVQLYGFLLNDHTQVTSIQIKDRNIPTPEKPQSGSLLVTMPCKVLHLMRLIKW